MRRALRLIGALCLAVAWHAGVAAAQCGTGCSSAASCDGTGSSACNVRCPPSEPCVCTDVRCDPDGNGSDHPILATHSGYRVDLPAAALLGVEASSTPATAEVRLDCGSSVLAVIVRDRHGRDLEQGLASIALGAAGSSDHASPRATGIPTAAGPVRQAAKLVDFVPEAAQGEVPVFLDRTRVVFSVEREDSAMVVDVAAGRDGTIYALRGNGTITRHAPDGSTRTIRGRGVPVSRNPVDGPGLAVGPDGRLYAFDRTLNTLSEFTAEGEFTGRKPLPTRFSPFYAFTVDRSGWFYFAAFSDEAPHGQVHRLCPQVDCAFESLGERRSTNDPDAARFFQSGYVALAADRLLFARLNPLRVYRLEPATGRGERIFSSGDLPDGEPLAYRTWPDGRRQITNGFPQTTGIAALPDGRILLTAFMPERGSSTFYVLNARGTLQARAEVPGHFRVKGVFADGRVVVLRNGRRQEVSVYRLTPAEGAARRAAPSE